MSDSIRRRAKLALGFVCFHVWMRLPNRWCMRAPASWLVPWASFYAYQPARRRSHG